MDKNNINDLTNEFVILRKITPWQIITNKLTYHYNDSKGCMGNPFRTVVGSFIVLRFQLFSDRTVVNKVKENLYIQYL